MTGHPQTVLFNDLHPSRCNGGEEQVLRQVILGLAARGWRCLLAYQDWGDLIPEYQVAGIECRQFSLEAGRLVAPGPFVKSIAQQVFWARRERVRLLHCNSYNRASMTAVAKILSGVPAICHLHLEPPEYLSRQYRWGLNQLERFIAVSAWSAAVWSQTLGLPRERFAVLHNAIDTSRFRPDDDARATARQKIGAGPDCFVIGYCGRIVRGKGVDLLVRAVAPLANKNPAIKLLVIGSDAQNILHYREPLVPMLKELAGQLGIAHNVTFLGARTDVERWYNAMDVLVVPAIAAEPFGLVVAEALACGLPAIASRVGGIPEVLNGALDELLVPPNDVDALIAALQRMIDDPERRSRFGALGRDAVKKNLAIPPYLDRLGQLLQGMLA